MQNLLLTFKGRKFYLTTELNLDEINGALLNDFTLDFSNDQGIQEFTEHICSKISKTILSSLEDTTFTEEEAAALRKHQVDVYEGDTLASDQLEPIPNGIAILEITLAKNIRGKIYLTSWVRDPVGRLWEVSPDEYVEGYHYFNNGFERLGKDYANLNEISFEEVMFI